MPKRTDSAGEHLVAIDGEISPKSSIHHAELGLLGHALFDHPYISNQQNIAPIAHNNTTIPRTSRYLMTQPDVLQSKEISNNFSHNNSSRINPASGFDGVADDAQSNKPKSILKLPSTIDEEKKKGCTCEDNSRTLRFTIDRDKQKGCTCEDNSRNPSDADDELPLPHCCTCDGQSRNPSDAGGKLPPLDCCSQDSKEGTTSQESSGNQSTIHQGESSNQSNTQKGEGLIQNAEEQLKSAGKKVEKTRKKEKKALKEERKALKKEYKALKEENKSLKANEKKAKKEAKLVQKKADAELEQAAEQAGVTLDKRKSPLKLRRDGPALEEATRSMDKSAGKERGSEGELGWLEWFLSLLGAS